MMKTNGARAIGRHTKTKNEFVLVVGLLLLFLLCINVLFQSTSLQFSGEDASAASFEQPAHESPHQTIDTNSMHKTLHLYNNYTSHWCHSRDLLTDSAKRATCLFHNLCVVPRKVDDDNPREVDFLYVTPNNISDDLHNIPGETSFTLGIGPHSGDNRVVFTPIAMAESELDLMYPHRQYLRGTSVLFYEYNAENFGHMLMDLILPIFSALESFGLLDKDVQMFRYSIIDAIGWSCDYQKIHRPGSYSHCLRFYDMIPEFTRGHEKMHVLNGTNVQPMCFETVVVGMGMYSDDCTEGSHGRKQNVWSLCNMARQRQFWDFRNYLLTNTGVSLDPPTKHKITITNRLDGRTLHNLGELVENIQGMYNKTIEITVVDWPKLSLKEQLEVISTTTVHISPPGGVSYIGVLLPRWATNIRLYSSDMFNDWHIFHYLGYIAVDHVDCKGGVIPIEDTMKLVAHSLKRFDSFS